MGGTCISFRLSYVLIFFFFFFYCLNGLQGCQRSATPLVCLQDFICLPPLLGVVACTKADEVVRNDWLGKMQARVV